MPEDKPKLMTQKEALEKLRDEFPELKAYDDKLLMKQIFERRPDLINKVENPMSGDAQAAQAQKRALAEKDKNSQFTRTILNSLPMFGAAAGGAIVGPETLGTGLPLGMASGAGVGRGLRDVVTQMLGIEDSTPMEKAANIGIDTGLAGVTPGLIDAVMHPRYAIGNALEDFTPGITKYLKPPILKKLFPTNAYTRPNIPSEAPSFLEEPSIRTPSSTATSSKLPEPSGTPVTGERPITTTGSTFQFRPPTVGPKIKISEHWNPKSNPDIGPSTIQWVRNSKGEWILKTEKE